MSAEGSAVQRAPRLHSLTGLRWWAAFAVFLFHMRNLAPLPGANGIVEFGNYGVTFFFILSGFVLTWSARSTTTIPTFYVNRFARIWPAAFVTLLLAIPVFYSFDPDPSQPFVKPFDLAILALSIPLIQGWWRDPVILFSGNPAAWTLTSEFFFYALHPFINRVLGFLRLGGTLVLTAVVVLLAFGHRALASYWPEYVLDQLPLPILRLNEFVLGMLVAHAIRLGWAIRIPAWLPLAGIAGIVALDWLAGFALLPARFADLFSRFQPELVLVLLTVAIASIAGADLAGKRSLFASRPIVTLGEWSFAFYLVHATVIYGLILVFGAQPAAWSGIVWYVPAFILSLALAGAVHLWVEKPLERRIRRAWALRQARHATQPAASPAP